MQVTSLSNVSAGIDRIGNAIMPGALRHHGIVENPNTRQPVSRGIGPVRHVRIDLRGHRAADAGMQGAEVMLALRILYDDIAPAIGEVVSARVAGGSLRPDAGLTIGSFVRPVAARIERQAVSVWAEVDKQTAHAYERTGRQSFGPALASEPEIRRDAVVIKGSGLEILSREAIAEIADREERRRQDMIQKRRTKRRKITLACTVMALIATILIGTPLLGTLIVPAILLTVGIMELALSPYAERLASAFAEVLGDVRSGRRQGRRSIVVENPVRDAGDRILEAVGRHAPLRSATTEEAIARIARLRGLAGESTDPLAHSEIASVESDLRATLQAYARPARLAVGTECHSLASDLAAATTQIGERAEAVRQRLLHEARDGFDTQRRYLASRGDEGLLVPVA